MINGSGVNIVFENLSSILKIPKHSKNYLINTNLVLK